MVANVAESRNRTSILPIEVAVHLKPLHKAVKETGQLIQISPWAFLASLATNNSSGSNNPGHFSNQTSTSSISPPPQTPLPMTPQSAALGPAVMATVPSSSASTYSGITLVHGHGGSHGGSNVSNGFAGNVNGNVSISSSSNGFLSNTTGSNYSGNNGFGGSVGMSHSNNSYTGSSVNIFNGNVFERPDNLLSISSTSSRSGTMTSVTNALDGSMTQASLLSPMNSMNGARFGKVGY